MSVIMTAFPGQFSYRELINLDFREFEFWGKKAQQILLQTQLKLLLTTRAAMAETDGFTMMKSSIESCLRELEVGKEKMVEEAWSSLKLTEKIK